METNYVAFFKEVKATKYDSLEQVLNAVEQLKVILDKRWKLVPSNDDYWYLVNVFEFYTHNKPLKSSLLLRSALINVHRSIKETYQTRESQLKVHVVRDVLTVLDIWLKALDVINDLAARDYMHSDNAFSHKVYSLRRAKKMITEVKSKQRRKRSFMVYQGSIFDGSNGRLYQLTKTENVIVPTNTNGLVDKLLKSWIETGLAKDIGEADYTRKEPRTADDNLLFRIAMLVQDDEVLMSMGTLTYLDDLDCLIKAEVHTTPMPAHVLQMYIVLKAICEMLDKPEVVKARDHILADLLVDKIVNTVMDEYIIFVGMLHKLYTA